MKKRQISIILCFAVGTALMAGCGTQSEERKTGENTSSSGSKEASRDGDSIITGYTWMAENETDAMYYKDYEEKLGEVTKEMVPKDFSIGVVSMASSNDYWINLNQGVKERCQELGIEVAVEYVEGPTDYEQTLTNAETLYNAGYSAYIFSPENETCLEEITRKIVGEGYPVINAYCCEINDATCFIGSLDSETARMAADLAIELLDGKGTVAVAEGDVAAKLAQTRTNYFIDRIEKNSDIKVEEIPAQWNPTTARTMTTDLLTANPDVSFIWCNNDDLGLGVYEGLREANAIDDCYVVSMDGTKAGLSSVASGEVYATYWNNPKLIGRLSVDACVRAAVGQDIPRVVTTDVELVTKENVEDYLEK
ncbi:D-allose-binding periplasmic protein precursor [uncultured Roseburia sp.]|uniref:Sugar ABC transporter substrate-binding protein n=1 Tax=Brotonthovivens ammoniilytica TaxID=2981725 RepID=A0ABT2TPU5_9FIRM|nr:sugar ABC transporter substrate-binding protein [Brotonthovivens ammoniilytica]MCU6763726.1 sugar ABC transporter substrate-binding protein [Brotonthovivens ammoniilytica]SCJ32952.1 D-allose-binding periplasmic protein precursor [uncultured Roseburia sp.]